MQRMQKFVKTGLMMIVLFAIVSSNVTIAENTSDIISSEITIEMNDGTNLSVSVETYVTKFTLEASGTTYTHQDIENNIDGTEKMGAIKYALRSALLKQIRESFENADVLTLTELPSYRNEKFYDSFQVDLTSDYFGINDSINSYELINGVLDMGAQVNYTLSLYSEEGWNNTYTINLADEIDYIVFTNGRVHNDNIDWDVFNWNGGETTKEAVLKIKKSKPTTSSKNEKINLNFILDTRQRQNSLKTNISLESIDISKYECIPDFITNLEYVPSDGIRLFIKNKMFDWNDTLYEKTIRPIQDKIKNTVENSDFNQTLDFIFNYDPETAFSCVDCYDVDKMDADPAIIGYVLDEEVDLKICDITPRALYGLINTGGVANLSDEDINFGNNLESIGYPYNITIVLHKKVLLNEMNEYIWNDTIEFEGIMDSKDSPIYHKEEINSVIDIEFKGSDLNLLGFFTGNPEINLGIGLSETKNFNVTRLPVEFSLPDKINIEYLNSDAIRLCIQENVFKEDEVNQFLSNIKKSFENRFSEIMPNLKIDGKINKDLFDESTEKTTNISKMEKQPPIETEMYANSILPIKYSYSFLPPSFKIPVQNYTFKGLENQSVKYRIFFPDGMGIEINDSLDRAVIKKTSDGKKYIEISFSADESYLSSTISYKITPSYLFLIGLFIPCIISFVIVIILIIVLFLIRRKRKYKKIKPSRKEKEEEYNGYEGEDYYVPPPPGSK